MIRFGFIVSSIVLGVILQLIFTQVLTVFHMGPDLLFLLVVAHAFIVGPVLGETMGFTWGLIADAFGAHYFGLQSLLFALTGYICGKLKRRVDSERPLPQVVIAVVATIFYGLGVVAMQSFFGEEGHRVGILNLLLKVFLNGCLASVVFWLAEHWVRLWKIEPEHL